MSEDLNRSPDSLEGNSEKANAGDDQYRVIGETRRRRWERVTKWVFRGKMLGLITVVVYLAATAVDRINEAAAHAH